MEPPKKPDEFACCNSGCNPCIFDVYEEQLKKYNAQKDRPLLHGPNGIKPLEFTQFRLISIRWLFDSCNLYIFQHLNNLPVYYEPGQYFLMRSIENEVEFTRAYTPIPYDLNPAQFAVIIRLYKRGQMARKLRSMEPGMITEWRGPYGEYKVRRANVLFIAQGTGIAPIYAIIKSMLENDDCDIRITLFYCCRCFEEILLRDELQSFLSYWNFTSEMFLGTNGGLARHNEVVHFRKLDREHVSEFLKGKSDIEVAISGNLAFNVCFREYIEELKVDVFTY